MFYLHAYCLSPYIEYKLREDKDFCVWFMALSPAWSSVIKY